MVEGVNVRLHRPDLPVGGFEFSDQDHRLLMVILQKLRSIHTILHRKIEAQKNRGPEKSRIEDRRSKTASSRVRRLETFDPRSSNLDLRTTFFLHNGRQPLCLMTREAAHRGARFVWNAI